MSEIKRVGLKLVLWVATVLLDSKLTNKQKEDLETIKTTISVTNFNE